MSLRRTDMISQITVSTLPLNLRSVIGDTSIIDCHAGKLVRMLLQGLLELETFGKCNRFLQPNTISLSRNFNDLTFNDMRDMCDIDSES